MPLYDCGAPDCEECQKAFGPDRTKAIVGYEMRKLDYAELSIAQQMERAMGPDLSREGIFQTHNCPVCQSGKRPCVTGNPHTCGNLFARND